MKHNIGENVTFIYGDSYKGVIIGIEPGEDDPYSVRLTDGTLVWACNSDFVTP